MAGFSELAESLMRDSKRNRGGHKEEMHTSTGAQIHVLTTVVWDCVKTKSVALKES